MEPFFTSAQRPTVNMPKEKLDLCQNYQKYFQNMKKSLPSHAFANLAQFQLILNPELCLVLPCLGAGHDHSEILGKLRNNRLDCFC